MWKNIYLIIKDIPKKQCRYMYYFNIKVWNYFPTAIFFLYKEEHPLNNKRYSQKKQCRYYFDIKVWQLLSNSHIFSVQKRRKKYIPKIIYDIIGKKQNNKFSRSLVPHYISKMIFYATHKVYGFSCTSLSTFLTSACVEPPY